MIQRNREVIEEEVAGVLEEHNAEIMTFTFPTDIVGIDIDDMTKWLVFEIEGLDPQEIIDNQYVLSSIITEHDSVRYQVMIKYGETVLYKSMVKTLYFDETLEVDNIQINLDDLSVLNQLKDQVNELKTQYETIIEEGNEDITKLISQVNSLETTIEVAEQKRESNERARQSEYEQALQDLSNAISEIQDLTSDYNQNATNKIKEYNINAEKKIAEINLTINQRIEDLEFRVNTQTGHLEVNLLEE